MARLKKALTNERQNDLEHLTIREAQAMAEDILKNLAQEADQSYAAGYKVLEPRVGIKDNKIIITITWPSWRLDVCSFILDADIQSNPTQSTEKIDSCDNQWLCNDEKLPYSTYAIRNKYTENTTKWIQKAFIYELLDDFLDGKWTPPWRCGFCRDRVKGIVKPRFH